MEENVRLLNVNNTKLGRMSLKCKLKNLKYFEKLKI